MALTVIIFGCLLVFTVFDLGRLLFFTVFGTTAGVFLVHLIGSNYHFLTFLRLVVPQYTLQCQAFPALMTVL